MILASEVDRAARASALIGKARTHRLDRMIIDNCRLGLRERLALRRNRHGGLRGRGRLACHGEQAGECQNGEHQPAAERPAPVAARVAAALAETC